MAVGKRVEGVELCDFVAAFGLPPELTYDQFIQLQLNVTRAQMRRVHDVVLALDIAKGSPAPFEYYELFTNGDRTAAGVMHGEQRLLQMMSGG